MVDGVAPNIVARDYAASGRRQQTSASLEWERRCLADSGEDADAPRLWDAWERLTAADREILALVAQEELSVADAARALGCSAPVFSVRLYRARRRLRQLLANEQSLSSVKPLEA